jgi:hypothetical protein
LQPAISIFTTWVSLIKDLRFWKVVLLGALASPICILEMACADSHLVSTVAQRPFEVSSDWAVMTPEEPIIAKRKVRELQVTVPRGVDWKVSALPRAVFILPDGTEFSLQAELLDQDGAVWPLQAEARIAGTGEGPVLFFPAPGPPDGTRIKTVKLRSTNPVRCLRVDWVCYNPEETKTGE